jgi:hypothetical protein
MRRGVRYSVFGVRTGKVKDRLAFVGPNTEHRTPNTEHRTPEEERRP